MFLSSVLLYVHKYVVGYCCLYLILPLFSVLLTRSAFGVDDQANHRSSFVVDEIVTGQLIIFSLPLHSNKISFGCVLYIGDDSVGSTIRRCDGGGSVASFIGWRGGGSSVDCKVIAFCFVSGGSVIDRWQGLGDEC